MRQDRAKRLAQIAPGRLQKTLYTTGGCESTEFAIKMARQASGKPGILCLDNAFHGLSVQALAACANKDYRRSASTELDPFFVTAPSPYAYRWANFEESLEENLATFVRLLDENPHIGAILAEPIQAVGGIAPPLEWWQWSRCWRRWPSVLQQRSRCRRWWPSVLQQWSLRLDWTPRLGW